MYMNDWKYKQAFVKQTNIYMIDSLESKIERRTNQTIIKPPVSCTLKAQTRKQFSLFKFI